MKLEAIAGNIAHAIKDRSSDGPFNLAVEFTDKATKGKSATGCVIAHMPDHDHYTITSYDQRYMDVDPALLTEELGAFFECDDDLDQRQPLIDQVNQLVADDPDNQVTLEPTTNA
ncbi:hypothetical protein [Lactiplantibacillus modestisalitolerans]|uniref:Uncharacterized protein n=1 Tax=Lactiplantibacillus modestisalitolerans TaxID=1457219 RepID=A0ABV5WXP9_9LACO|nr:hypothetical protein [Lactiplantibacillus modestisalitolerans]